MGFSPGRPTICRLTVVTELEVEEWIKEEQIYVF